MSEDLMPLKLKRPIEFGGQTIDELTFQPFKAKHMRGVTILVRDGGIALAPEDILKVAARLAGVLPAALDELGQEDYSEVLQRVTPLFL